MERFRWGILGTGRIANKFAAGLADVEGAELVAVGSRSREGAEAFGSKWNLRKRHASYAALAADAEVDAIYVSTPHNLHCENTLLCLEAGKPVLCEKPFAMNAPQVEEMIRCARQRGVFLMEGMWTRWNPVTVRVRELVREGAIGSPRMLQCDLGFRAPFDPGSRLFDLALGGGALLDVGVYCVAYAHMIFGAAPEEVVGLADRGATGADEQSACILRFGDGALAVLSSAVRTNTPVEATISGTDGSIRVPRFYDADRLFLKGEEILVERAGNGFNYEAAEVQRLVRAGKLESDVLPLDESLAILRTLDRIRAQWGLRYPAD
jgi:predicted dehydrogenase